MTREERIKNSRLGGLKRAAREAARRPYPWWKESQLVGRNTIIAKKLLALAGQDAVIIFGKGADPVERIEPGPTRVKVSTSPVGGEAEFGWVRIDHIYHGFKLAAVQGVFSLDEAKECGVLP